MTFASSVGLGAGIAILYVVGRAVSLSRTRSAAPLPPGPKGLPLVGNVNDLPEPGTFEAHHWLKHKELYGPISSVTVLGNTLIIVNDAQLALEILDKRSAKHSSRPKQVFAGELIGWDQSLGLTAYNDRFRAYRKNMSRILGSRQAAAQFNPMQEAEVAHFLLHVLDDPDGLVGHIRKEAGALILRIAYGYVAEPHGHDVLIDMAGEAMDNFTRAAVPGAWLVDMLPFLKSLPEWMPGTGFKQVARQWASELHDIVEKPYAFVKYQLSQGKDNTSFLAKMLETNDDPGEEQERNKLSAMSLYTAGADTTVSSMACFFLAMSAYPEVQRQAQEEIDRVVGKDRLPIMADREKLPFVEATVKEVLRWHPVAPMGLPHSCTEDDVVQGYLIPQNSMIFPNVWHFTHDPEVYFDPMAFRPERFLGTKDREPEPDPRQFVFGYGRRICPGRILAENGLYLNIAQSLAVFSIGRHVEDGQEVEPIFDFTSGVISHPKAFKTKIKPRSPAHEALVRSLEDVYPWEESDGSLLKSMSS